jgi:energy-converting hydrogenase Eha subunit A
MPWRRAIAVWLVLIGGEMIHGIVRSIVLTPRVGDKPARQIGVFTGSLVNLGITHLFIEWIGARTVRARLVIGVVWVVLTMVFEVAFGRLVVKSSWERIRSDYDLPHGGLLPIGLVALAGSPLVASRLRGMDSRR